MQYVLTFMFISKLITIFEFKNTPSTYFFLLISFKINTINNI